MKRKGSRAERELVAMFWEAGHAALRAPGSGSTPLPSPDILASIKRGYLAIECKSLASNQKTFKPEDFAQLEQFAKAFNAEAWIGMRFDYDGWYFIQPKDVKQTGNGNFSITKNLAKLKGISFEELTTK